MRYICFSAILSICLFLLPCTLHALDEDSKDMQQLLNKINELEKQLKRIEEENKARKTLEITDEEKAQQEKEVLDAVSRDYSLDPKYTLGVDYGFNYQFSRTEQITTNPLLVQRNSDHTITHSIASSYSFLDNLSGNMTLPIVYKYNKLGTKEEMDQADLGDISFGVAWQPVKRSSGEVQTTLSFGVSLPTGRSPYKINPEQELSTGDGTYSFSLGANFSKQVDPVVVFWSLGYKHALELTNLSYRVNADANTQVTLQEVTPGDTLSFSGGLAYALSYATSINMSFGYSYGKGSKFKYKGIEDSVKQADNVGASFGVGMGWRISQKTTLSYSLSYDLAHPSFALSFRVPFSFVL